MPKGDIVTTIVSGQEINFEWHLGYAHPGKCQSDLMANALSFYVTKTVFILVVTKLLWSSPNQFGQTKTILD